MDIDQIIAGVAPFLQPDESPPGSRVCEYARYFAEWCEEHIAPLTKEPSAIAVAYKKVLLQDKWHDYRNAVPRQHRDYVGRGHVCLYHTYCRYYQTIRLVELSLPSSIPFGVNQRQEPKRSLPPQQIAGIVIGEG